MQKLNIIIEKNTSLRNVHIVHFEGAFDGSMK